MSRFSLLDNPLLLGFDHLEQMLDRVSRSSSSGFPPYNIEQIGEDHLRITLAVAGFEEQDLSISLEDNQLIVRGQRQQEDDQERYFIYRGIAFRQFQKAFVLAEGIQVKKAWMHNGLLNIDLIRLEPQKRVQSIEITHESGDGEDRQTETISVDSGDEPRQN